MFLRLSVRNRMGKRYYFPAVISSSQLKFSVKIQWALGTQLLWFGLLIFQSFYKGHVNKKTYSTNKKGIVILFSLRFLQCLRIYLICVWFQTDSFLLYVFVLDIYLDCYTINNYVKLFINNGIIGTGNNP